jgi:hypothetical protein
MGKELNKIKVTKSKSILGFETSGGGTLEIWDRYLTLDGKRAYYLGNICGTCSFLFERLGGANQEIKPETVASQLKLGITDLDMVIDEVKKLMPNEEYYVNQLTIKPQLVQIGSDFDYFKKEQVEEWGMDAFWGFAHHPKIQYYRGKTLEFSQNKMLYEFIVPMFPQGWLDEVTINEYKEFYNQGIEPTALSISILDIKQCYDSEVEHWCLTHYVIDGHHKIYAASQMNQSLSLLSFLAINKGVSSEDEIRLLLEKLLKLN